MFDLYRQLLSRKIIWGTTVGAAIFFMIIGVVYWGAFNTAMEVTNTLDFCISCHEMKDNVYQEYKTTVHYTNRSGVRATCPDCHVPKEWDHKVIRKINATNELFHKAIGSINTQEKFNSKRLALAQMVWAQLKGSDSRECKNCHNFTAMNISAQKSRSGLVHKYSQNRGKTCIDCHKGIAHHLPAGVVRYKGGSDEDHVFYASVKLQCHQCHDDAPKPAEDTWK